jgi:hypothetical protein
VREHRPGLRSSYQGAESHIQGNRAGLRQITGAETSRSTWVSRGSWGCVEACAEPGGAAAIPLVLAWLAPLLALATLALLLPRWGVWALAGLTVVLVAGSVWFAIDPAAWRMVEHQTGPVRAVAVFVLAGALGVLGLKRTATAGSLLLAAALGPVVISGLGSLPSVASLSPVSVIPVITGVLYLVSAQLTRSSATIPPRRTPQPVNLCS